MRHESARRRSFLFLQGPPGPFFRRLGETMRARGHQVARINFNGGDRGDWPDSVDGPNGTDFRGTAEEWPRFFDAFVKDREITDVVLFGDCRQHHHAARGLAKIAGLRVHVFEEGYIRPDWVTLELDGVNGNSQLSRDPDWYLAAARGLPPLPQLAGVPSSFERRANEAIAYYTRCILEGWRFPHHRLHREGNPMVEGIGWMRRLARTSRARLRTGQMLERLSGRRFFLFPLQLDSDHQVRVHSPFGSMRVAIRFVVASFARAAPKDAVLVVKEHPLDNGLIDWRQLTLRIAAALGVRDRVIYLEGGDIAQLVENAEGLVTINSTTGTLSIGRDVPTAVLGQAVYDVAGITHQGPLDRFWNEPEAPDPRIWDAFCRVLYDRCLIHGGFASDAGIDLLIEGAGQRLTRPPGFPAAMAVPGLLLG